MKLSNYSSLALVRPNGKLRLRFSTKPLWVYGFWSPVAVCFVYAWKPYSENTLQGEQNLPSHKSLQHVVMRVAKCFCENELLSHLCYVVGTAVAFY